MALCVKLMSNSDDDENILFFPENFWNMYDLLKLLCKDLATSWSEYD